MLFLNKILKVLPKKEPPLLKKRKKASAFLEVVDTKKLARCIEILTLFDEAQGLAEARYYRRVA